MYEKEHNKTCDHCTFSNFPLLFCRAKNKAQIYYTGSHWTLVTFQKYFESVHARSTYPYPNCTGPSEFTPGSGLGPEFNTKEI